MFARFSVKKPYTVIVGILLVIALGVISFINMTTDLLPSMDLPYIIVYTVDTGATPEAVEKDVSQPLEEAFSTLTDVKNVSSTSNENLSLVVMEFEAGADMNAAMIEISSAIDRTTGSWSDSIGTPVIMKLNPDMLPVTVATVSLDDADLLALSDYVEDELIRDYEAVDGVASVTASGLMTQQVDITIEQSRVDAVNSAVLKDVDKKLAKVESQLRDAQGQISRGKAMLAKARTEAYAKLDEAAKAIAGSSETMPETIAAMTAQREQLAQQLEGVEAGLAQLDGMADMPEEEKQRILGVADEIKALEAQKKELQAALNSGEGASTLAQQIANARASRDELNTLRTQLLKELEDLGALDAKALEKTIADLESAIATNEAEDRDVCNRRDEAIRRRDTALSGINELNVSIAALESLKETPEAAEEEAAPEEETKAVAEGEEGETVEEEAEGEEEPSGEDEETPQPGEEGAPTGGEDDPERQTAEATEEEQSTGEEGSSEQETPTEEGSSEQETPVEEGSSEQETHADDSGSSGQETPADDQGSSGQNAPSGDEGASEQETPASDEGSSEQKPAGDESASEQKTSDNGGSSEQKPADGESSSEQKSSGGESSSEQKASGSDASSEQKASGSESSSEQKASSEPKSSGSDASSSQKSSSEQSEAQTLSGGRRAHVSLLDHAARAEAAGATLEELYTRRDELQAEYDAAVIEVDNCVSRHEALRETLTQQSSALEEARDALAVLKDGQIAVQEDIEKAQAKLADVEAQIADKDAEIAALTAAAEAGDADAALQGQIADVDARIEALKASPDYDTYRLMTDKKAAKARRKQLEEAQTQLTEGITSIDSMVDKLSRGIIPGGMIEGLDKDMTIEEAAGMLDSARAQVKSGLAKASSALKEAEDKIAKAWREFEDKRDEALEEAGIDGILTVQLVSQIIGAQNFDMPAGYVSDPDGRYLVSVGTKFKSLNELRETKLFSLGLDTIDEVRLMDVAKVEISDNSADLFTFVNGESGVMLSFEKQSTASTSEVARAITAHSKALMAENEKLHVVEMFNQGDYISLIVDSVLDNIKYGGVLAILVLLLFLLDWRPTLIVAISIPTSIVVAFVGMYFTGISLNVMSLSGLALGVGMLVDNSIVSIENIYRLKDEEHLPILTACIRGVNQVGGALLASTLTTICVFLPVVFVNGIARDLFSDMGLTIAYSLLASLLVAMTVVPSFAATLFKNSKTKEHRGFTAFQNGYTALLRSALKVKWLVLLIAVALAAWSGWRAVNMAITFMPTVNSTQMGADLSFKNSKLTEEEEKAVALRLMNDMMAIDGVNDVSLTTGGSMSMMSSMSGGGSGYSYYILLEEGSRVNKDVANEIYARAADVCDGKTVILDVQESTMDMSAFAGSGISVDIFGDDIETLNEAARRVAAVCEKLDGIKNLDDGSSENEPKLVVTVDKELANEESLTVAQVYQYIAQRLYGAVELTEAELNEREYTLYVSTDKDLDLEPGDIADMEIEVKGADKTKYVRIGDIATISDGETLSGIKRENMRRKVSVSFALEDGVAANKLSDELSARLKEIELPKGCSYAISGQNEQVMGYMSDLLTMLGIAVLFIFLIMVAQFQSFKSPIIVMFTIPLAFTGGLIALFVTGMDLSIIALVGFLVLSGVVVNNGIVFIDSVNQMRIGGMSKREAILETGRIRLRPILMTALTTILGMSTMAFGKGMGSEMMQPMAIVTIGGLTYATLMTLFVVPALYDIFNGETLKAREIEMMKEAAGMKREGFDDEAALM